MLLAKCAALRFTKEALRHPHERHILFRGQCLRDSRILITEKSPFSRRLPQYSRQTNALFGFGAGRVDIIENISSHYRRAVQRIGHTCSEALRNAARAVARHRKKCYLLKALTATKQHTMRLLHGMLWSPRTVPSHVFAPDHRKADVMAQSSPVLTS